MDSFVGVERQAMSAKRIAYRSHSRRSTHKAVHRIDTARKQAGARIAAEEEAGSRALRSLAGPTRPVHRIASTGRLGSA
jgi:hypothetical protein